jgi:hypothetical protein
MSRRTDVFTNPARMLLAFDVSASPQERRELIGILMGQAKYSATIRGILARIGARHIEAELSPEAQSFLVSHQQAAREVA